jgi:glycosyltransferase involved in cell wall biosynthesis
MRIAIVTPVMTQQDGQGRVNLELARCLLARGHSLVLVTAAVDAGLLGDAQVRWVRMPGAWLPTFLLREQAFAIASVPVLARLRGRLDTIVVNGFVTWWRSDVNLVHFVHAAWLKSASHPRHGGSLRGLYRWLYTRLNVALERNSFDRAHALVAVSELVRRQLIDCGMPPGKIHVVPNGVDLDAFAPGPGRRADFGLPDGPVMALFAGDIRSSRKNLDTVLRALADVPELHLAVAGKLAGSPYPQMVQRLGLGARVHFLGLRPDIPALMRAVDMFVFPSRFEPFGLVMLEASACGLPVIASRAAGASDALANDGLIVLDDPDDVPGLAAALRRLAADRAVRARMGHCARKAAEALSWQVATARHAHVIELVGASLAPAAALPHTHSWEIPHDAAG